MDRQDGDQFRPFWTDFSNFGTHLNNDLESNKYVFDKYNVLNKDNYQFGSSRNQFEKGSTHFETNNNNKIDENKGFYVSNSQFNGDNNSHLSTNNSDQFGDLNNVGTNNNAPFGDNANHYCMNYNSMGATSLGQPVQDCYGSRAVMNQMGRVTTFVAGAKNTHNAMGTNVLYSNKEGVPGPRGRPPTHLRPLNCSGKREKEELVKLDTLRAEMPYLTRQQTSDYRHSFYHNLCLGILKDGYHRTFSELFHLIRQQEDARQKAGPDSTLWNQTPLSRQPQKLLKMRDTLCCAEDAERNKDLDKVYNAYLLLATYFKSHPEDKWLMDHYYCYCLTHATRIENDDNRKLAEAHLNMGTSVEENGDIHSAVHHFETFYTLSMDKDWYDEMETLLHSKACEHLARVYTLLASTFEDGEQQVKDLKSAHSMAKESGNRKLEGQCGYRLGLAYEKVGKPDTALLFLRGFYESSKAINDDENLGFACEAMAKAYERQDKINDSIRFLQEFVEVTARSGQNQLYSRACRDLGAVFNKLGRYEESAEYFNKAFMVARSLNDVSAAHDARLLLGIAISHGVLPEFNHYTDKATKCALSKSLEWKNSRGELKEMFNAHLNDAPSNTLASRKPKRKVLKLTN